MANPQLKDLPLAVQSYFKEEDEQLTATHFENRRKEEHEYTLCYKGREIMKVEYLKTLIKIKINHGTISTICSVDSG